MPAHVHNINNNGNKNNNDNNEKTTLKILPLPGLQKYRINLIWKQNQNKWKWSC